MSTLYIVATPIGNLEDLSRRAERILREVPVVLCEDTRVTKKLLDSFSINGKQLISYHAHSPERRTKEILELLRSGTDAALVSDAGTPGVNDPGGRLIERIVRANCGVRVVPLPGPAALAAALSISGFPADRFVYLGFPPHKKGREKFFKTLADIHDTIVFLESPHRIMKALASMALTIPERSIMVGRELTKLYETVYRGTPVEVTEQLQSGSIKGEFVVVLRAVK